MATRTLGCIDTTCPVTIPFHSVDDLRRNGVKALRTFWKNPAQSDELNAPSCTHNMEMDTAHGFLSDLAVITIPAPAWVLARRKFGISRDEMTGMPLAVDPYEQHPILKSFYLPDELRWLPIPMVWDDEFGERIPKRETLELLHMSALTGLRYVVLSPQLDECPGKVTIDRIIRYNTRLFLRWWKGKQE